LLAFLFRSAESLENYPPTLNFVIKRALPPQVYPGLMIEYTVSPLLGIPLTWLTEIVQVDAPHRFVDEQRVGPYRLWHHKHSFRALPGGGTEVHDLVTYVPPLGPFGASSMPSSSVRNWNGFSIIGGRISLPPLPNRRLDPAFKTALPNVLPTRKGSAFWNSKTSKRSSI
jgi:ligand-binding SRPBCC domain-containing protein